MKAFVTSIGESTTDLCVWSLQRQGFAVELVQSKTSLVDKLRYIYEMADDTFLRVDADVIVNRNVQDLVLPPDIWWLQARCFGWFSQDIIHGGIQLYGKELLPILRRHIEDAEGLERPETYLSRLPELHEPRRFASGEVICGIHGVFQNDIQRVKDTKAHRRQMDNYDFELAEAIERLGRR